METEFLGPNLRRLRDAKKLSQGEAAERAEHGSITSIGLSRCLSWLQQAKLSYSTGTLRTRSTNPAERIGG